MICCNMVGNGHNQRKRTKNKNARHGITKSGIELDMKRRERDEKRKGNKRKKRKKRRGKSEEKARI